jgi:hypothetical protein
MRMWIQTHPNASTSIVVLAKHWISVLPFWLEIFLPVEHFLMRQIDAASGTVLVLASNNPLPTPVDLTLPAIGSTKAAGTYENARSLPFDVGCFRVLQPCPLWRNCSHRRFSSVKVLVRTSSRTSFHPALLGMPPFSLLGVSH